MKEAYGSPKKFHGKSLELIVVCNDIVEDYAGQGFKLTVRQIYYQLVARGHVPNTVQSYNNVQSLLNDARLAGLIDWDHIEDRTREIMERSRWSSGGELLQTCAKQYFEDMWEQQPYRIFVIVEKEALAGVLERTCNTYDVPLLPARGYPSATTLRELAKQRIMGARQQIVLLHLGDHDPSGMDMSRDLRERLELFSRHHTHIEFRRLALNMDQIEEQQPPPNPAKTTDARFRAYQELYGDESWELDALTPQFIHGLVSKAITGYIDIDLWKHKEAKIKDIRARLQDLADNFDKDDE